MWAIVGIAWSHINKSVFVINSNLFILKVDIKYLDLAITNYPISPLEVNLINILCA
jgi:hypothetical protein